MRPECAALLMCPVCGSPLALGEGVVSCGAGHSFDIARSGYVNLLPARKKLGATVGDSRAMLEARARFLGTGHYSTLAAAVREAAADGRCVLDVGAGTGYYLSGMEGSGRCLIAVDISKEAAKTTARQLPEAVSVLADVKRQIPVLAGSADVVLDVFAPRNAAEFHRVLDPGGVLVVVVPGPGHLSELIERFHLLSVPADKEHDVHEDLAPRFELIRREELEGRSTLEPDATLDLIGMGPSARHVDLISIRDELGSDATEVTTSFVMLVYRPRQLET